MKRGDKVLVINGDYTGVYGEVESVNAPEKVAIIEFDEGFLMLDFDVLEVVYEA